MTQPTTALALEFQAEPPPNYVVELAVHPNGQFDDFHSHAIITTPDLTRYLCNLDLIRPPFITEGTVNKHQKLADGLSRLANLGADRILQDSLIPDKPGGQPKPRVSFAKAALGAVSLSKNMILMPTTEVINANLARIAAGSGLVVPEFVEGTIEMENDEMRFPARTITDFWAKGKFLLANSYAWLAEHDVGHAVRIAAHFEADTITAITELGQIAADVSLPERIMRGLLTKSSFAVDFGFGSRAKYFATVIDRWSDQQFVAYPNSKDEIVESMRHLHRSTGLYLPTPEKVSTTKRNMLARVRNKNFFDRKGPPDEVIERAVVINNAGRARFGLPPIE